MPTSAAENMNEYIAAFPAATQVLLQEVRAVIKQAAPSATERMSYGMPCFRTTKNLVYFAGYKKHIGFYPGAATIKHFEPKLVAYRYAKGSVQFPLNRPIPRALIAQMVAFRIHEILNKEI